ncbi:MAG: hypothetical protein GVY24_08270 [Planctomycetes bacterium]|nr:hypothetical protein [Planctomycetota bacterium]
MLAVLTCTLGVTGCRGAGTAEVSRSLAQIESRRQQARVLNDKALASSDPARQRAWLEEAIALDDLYGEARNNLGVCYYQAGEFYPAATQLQRAADLMPGAVGPYVNLAILHGALGQWERSLEFAEQAAERDPYDVGVLRATARALYALRAKREQIAPVLEMLAQRDPEPVWREWAVGQRLQLTDREGHGG